MTRARIDLKFLPLAAILASVLLPPAASAGLGEPETAVAGDAQALKGSVKSIDQVTYRVHAIQLPSGTVLREYAVVGGDVFAVTWSGPALPNLRQALGGHFDTYVTAVRSKHGSRHHLEFQQGPLVVQSSGHMRAFTGRAYLPQGLPSGVSVDELR